MILVREWHEETSCFDHASGKSGDGGDYGADYYNRGIMLLTCRQHVFAPQRDRDLGISLGGGMARGALFTAS